jgi:RimJ/RimL family protein N-acetyltransferase
VLVEIALADIDSLLSADHADRPVAPGWPHADTVAAFNFLHSGGTQFLIIDDNGRVAGECGTKSPPDVEGRVEIGYGLAASSRGQRLGSRAVSELLDWLRRHPQITTVEAEIHVSNEPSRRLVERLGFTLSGSPERGYVRYHLLLSVVERV